jgi:hypothetical protein
MPVEVVDHEPVLATALLIDELRHTGTRRESVIVEHDRTAGRQARPHPIEHLRRGLVNVDVDVAEPEAPV